VDWNQIGGLLQRYAGTTPAQTSDSAEDDWHKVAQAAPPQAISDGLAESFRSQSTPPFPQMLSQLFGNSDPEHKATILNMLTSTLGSGALTSILSRYGVGQQNQVTPDQARAVSPDAVRELAEHAEHKDQSIIDRVSDFYAQQPGIVKTLGAAALTVALAQIGRKHKLL
jgi:hypothetical protein